MFTIINIITTTNIIIKFVIFCCKIPSIGCEIIILTTVLSLVLISGFYYVTISPSRSVRCETKKPPAMRVRVEGYTQKTPNAIQ